MDSLTNNIKILFCNVNPEKISNLFLNSNVSVFDKNNLTFQKISKNDFSNYSHNYYQMNSLDEREIYYAQLCADEKESEKASHFNLLAKFGENTIEMNGDIPLIRFNKILQWRELTLEIGQAEIISAFLAKKSLNDGVNYTYWNWPTALKTNNRQLLSILREGISENHFHLNGSTQIFPISWISIMNNPTIIGHCLKNFDVNLYPRTAYGYKDNRDSWETLLKTAAIIRIKLFSKLYFNKIYNEEYGYFQNINNGDVQLLSLFEIEKKAKNLACQFSYKTKYGSLDYALTNEFNDENFGYNRILVGERKFLYDCFKESFDGNFTECENNQLYYYLLVKNQFRSELIQSNNITGFKNFSNYQNRKSYFIKNFEKYKIEAVRLSLNDTLQCQSIKSLEARIMPSKTPKELIESIEFYNKYYDEAIYEHQKKSVKIDDFSSLLKNHINVSSMAQQKDRPYFFVLHYPKRKTIVSHTSKNKVYESVYTGPKNATQRNDNLYYSKSIANVLFRRNDMRKFIRGIDTCSFEIYCRPEVFATDYRFLKNSHSIDNSGSSCSNEKKRFLHLGKTYHAGEDFYDIVDGIRTIDEVIRFLEYSNGDRIGHALALGLNPEEYYTFKNKKIVIPKQEALDNFIWLYYRALEFNINIEPILEQKLKYYINELSIEIYGNFCTQNNIILTHYNLYCAWKLRGDSPDLYLSGKFIKPKIFLNQYEKAKFIDNEYLNSLRNDTNISYLYYAYHYDRNVRFHGEKPYEFHIDANYIKLVKAVQKKLRFELSKKHIMIECNPSSNYLISTINAYENHPITTFNNLNLEIDAEKIKECAQLSVSINTDDQGVFDTSLEYEYALMTSALINSVDENGNNRYSPLQVYNYIDNVRRMGNEQTFLKT